MSTSALLAFLPAFLSAFLFFSQTVNAHWIFSHSPLVHTRLDPIVSPGKVGGHVHNVVGADAFAASYDYNLQRKASCTTAPVQGDLSSYWTPQLYYERSSDKKLTAVETAYVNTYYLPRNGPRKDPIKAFPAGLRILAGDPNRKTFNPSDFTHTAISYVCLDFTISHSGDPAWAQRNSFFEGHNCPSGMRAQINFPSCWDGVNLDSADHKSHMAYPIQNVDGGDCPASHPVQLVQLFYEFIYSTQKYDLNHGSLVWANGDKTGYGFHGDFTNGWAAGKDSLLQKAIDTCPGDTAGNLERCAVFVPSMDKAKKDGCVPANPIVGEDVGINTWLNKLPGNNYVDGSKTPEQIASLRTAYVESAALANATEPLLPGWTSKGCYTEGTSGRALQGYSTSNTTSMTPNLCISICAGKGFSFAATEWAQECFCGSELMAGSTNAGSPVCAHKCTGNKNSICGGSSTISLYTTDTPSKRNVLASHLSRKRDSLRSRSHHH